MAPLPEDFEYEYCAACNHRNLTPELEKRFLAVEKAWLKAQKTQKTQGGVDLYALQSATWQAVDYIKSTILRVQEYKKDGSRVKRLKRRECPYCFHFRTGFAGQAFTDWKCRNCGAEDQHANTAVPILCNDCSKNLNACVRCMADLDLKRRKTLKQAV
jgi:DNA-directed RNA polymerase subunit RPC12/RpoP